MPEPPNDLVLARKEYRKYVNNFGQLKMSLKKEFVHYHIKQECLKSKDSAFDPHNIIVTGHIRSDLQDMWEKAEKLVTMKHAVCEIPDHPNSRRVTSLSLRRM